MVPETRTHRQFLCLIHSSPTIFLRRSYILGHLTPISGRLILFLDMTAVTGQRGRGSLEKDEEGQVLVATDNPRLTRQLLWKLDTQCATPLCKGRIGS